MSQSVEVKLYVGNLAAETTENDLRQLFAQTGTVTSVNLIKDRTTGQSKGFAFVTMSSAAGAQKAVATLHTAHLGGRPLTVNVADRPQSLGEHAKSQNDRPKGQGQRPKAPEGYQSKLGAFSVTTRSPNASPKTSKPGDGYVSKLGAYGVGGRPPAPKRRGGNNQRH